MVYREAWRSLILFLPFIPFSTRSLCVPTYFHVFAHSLVFLRSCCCNLLQNEVTKLAEGRQGGQLK